MKNKNPKQNLDAKGGVFGDLQQNPSHTNCACSKVGTY
jgi:hypothetical protein